VDFTGFRFWRLLYFAGTVKLLPHGKAVKSAKENSRQIGMDFRRGSMPLFDGELELRATGDPFNYQKVIGRSANPPPTLQPAANV